MRVAMLPVGQFFETAATSCGGIGGPLLGRPPRPPGPRPAPGPPAGPWAPAAAPAATAPPGAAAAGAAVAAGTADYDGCLPATGAISIAINKPLRVRLLPKAGGE
jgi:hypothetical protein